jgi:hypothetical protein
VNRDRRGKTPEMAISERELIALTRQLDDLHESTFPQARKAIDELAGGLAAVTRAPATRRTFFLGAAGALALGAAAACSSGSSTAAPAPASGAAGAGGTYIGDMQFVALSAALENLGVAAYGGALKAAVAGTLGTVPPAVATFVQSAMKQHADHAQAWNAVLTRAGKPPIDGAPLTITQDQVNMLNAARSVPDVAKLALNLENAAAQTYTLVTANVSDAGGITTAATIQPVETMHAAILNFILGQDPVPDSFIGIESAIQPSALTAK